MLEPVWWLVLWTNLMNWFKRMKFVLLTVDKHWMKQQTWRKWAGAGAGGATATGLPGVHL